MNIRLIRAAIAFYPPDWRRRYGGELEELITEACASTASRVKKGWLVAGVAACGIRERLPGWIGSYAPRLVVVLATAAVAAIAVLMLNGGGQVSSKVLVVTPTPLTLAPGAHLGPSVKRTEDRSIAVPAGTKRIFLSVNPGSRTLDGAIGAPATVEVDPNTNQVLAITARRAR